MRKPHVLAIPYPAQGHVLPMLELMQCLAKHGFKVTFVNTEFTQERVINTLAGKDSIENHIHLISIPDGLEPWENRNELGKLTEAIFQIMPGKLEELIEKINGSDNDKITCIIADQLLGWALEVAEKMQINIPALLDDGIINDNGTPTKNQMFQLSPTMPAISTSHLVRNNRSVQVADWLICNSAYELKPAAFSLFPNILPIGPLLARNRLGNSAGYFWPEDSTCLE
ncbi:hypothetical protein ACSBR2_010302 [Camellia fascicularis]